MHTRTKVLLLCCVVYILSLFHRSSIAVISFDIASSLEVSLASLGYLSGTTMLAYGIMQLPSGLLADAFGGRRVTIWLTTLAAIAAFAVAFSPNLFTASAARFCLGLGVAVFVPILTLLATAFPPNMYGRAVGVLSAASGLGGIIAATPLLLLSNAMGWRGALLIFAAFTLCAVVLFSWFTRGIPKQANPALLHTKKTNVKAMGKNIMRVFRTKQFWPLCIWQITMTGPLFMLTILWFVPYLVQANGLSQQEASLFLITFAVLPLIIMPLTGYLSDAVFKARRGLVIAFGVLSVIAAILFVTHSGRMPFWLLAVQMVLIASGISGANPLVFTMVKEVFPPSLTGTATGCLNMFYPIFVFFIQIIFGNLIEWQLAAGASIGAAYRTAGWVILICHLIGFTCTLLMKETFGREPKE